jgi:hypothetical protein
MLVTVSYETMPSAAFLVVLLLLPETAKLKLAKQEYAISAKNDIRNSSLSTMIKLVLIDMWFESRQGQ